MNLYYYIYFHSDHCSNLQAYFSSANFFSQIRICTTNGFLYLLDKIRAKFMYCKQV
jgi:hypothetical protein